jgi:Tfp pilus assembly protein PilX
MNKRGSVLLQVLVTSVVVALIAATLLRMSLLRAQAASRGAKSLQEKRSDQAALASLLETWNQKQMVCASPTPDYTCVPASAVIPGKCGCTCAPTTAGFPTVTTALVGGICQLSIVSINIP